MSSFAWFSFAGRFALTDLFGRGRSLRVTLVNQATILALSAATLLIYGLVLGTEARQLARFRGDPEARGVVFRPTLRGTLLPPAAVAKLTAAVRGRLAEPGRLLAAAPFHQIHHEWYPPNVDHSPSYRGRTLAASDPLFESYRHRDYWLRGGPPDANNRGVVLSGPLLERLGISPDAIPARLETRTGLRKEPVPIAGVFKHDLPGRYDYLLPEALWEELRHKADVPRATEILSGPLPSKWAERDELPRELVQYLKEQGVEWRGVRRTGPSQEVWVFKWSGEDRRGQVGAPPLTRWQVTLEAVAAEMMKLANQNAPGFTMPYPIDPVLPKAEAEPEGYDRIALYFETPEDARPAIQAARPLDLVPEDDRHEQLERIRNMTSKALGLLTVINLAVALLGAWNLYVIQDQQAEQKVPEVGMLKAMGMPGSVLVVIYLLEAVLVWLPGLLVGLLVGWGAGVVVEQWLGRDDPTATLAFSVPMVWLAGIVAVSFVLFLGGMYLATRRSRNASPVECLRG